MSGTIAALCDTSYQIKKRCQEYFLENNNRNYNPKWNGKNDSVNRSNRQAIFFLDHRYQPFISNVIVTVDCGDPHLCPSCIAPAYCLLSLCLAPLDKMNTTLPGEERQPFFNLFFISFCLLSIKETAIIFLPRQPGRTSKKGRYHDKYSFTSHALIGLARRHGAPGSKRNGLKG